MKEKKYQANCLVPSLITIILLIIALAVNFNTSYKTISKLKEQRHRIDRLIKSSKCADASIETFIFHYNQHLKKIKKRRLFNIVKLDSIKKEDYAACDK